MDKVIAQLKKVPSGVLTAAVLLVFIPIWTTFISPQILRTPVHFNFSSDVISVDNFYDPDREQYTGEIFSSTIYTFNTVAATDDSLTLSNTFAVRTPDGDPIFAVERTYGVDRYTGEHIPMLGDKPRTGYLFAPRNLKEGESFIYWHINYDAPAEMDFVASEDLYGLEVFHYKSIYADTDVDQTENLTYLPGVGTEYGINLDPELDIWVEPVSGRLIKYADDTIAYYYDLDSGERIRPWNHFSNRISEESVVKNVEVARQLKSNQTLINTYLPLLLILAAVIVVLNIPEFNTRIKSKISLHWIYQAGGLGIASASLLVILGWWIRSTSLIKLATPGNATLNPITAVCFLIIGLAIATKHQRNQSDLPQNLAGLTLLVLAGLRTLSIFNLTDWQIDQVFFRSFVLETGSRMSLFTTTTFFLMGVLLLANSFALLRKLRIAEITAITTMVISSLAILGYLFESITVIGLPFFIDTSFLTAFMTLIAAMLGFFSFRDRRGIVLSELGNFFLFSVLFALILVSISLAGIIESNATNEAESRFDNNVSRITAAIEDRVNIYVSLLQGAKGLLAASDSVEREEWRAYVESLSLEENYPGIQGIGYSVFVKPEDLASHVQKIKAQGFPNYVVKPEGIREVYTAIVYLEPFDTRNQQAFGFDMFQETTRRSAMEQARDSGESRMSGIITLVQEIDSDVQPGFLIYTPYYGNDVDETELTTEQRQEMIVGYTYSPFRARNFVEGALVNETTSNIGLKINDGVTIQSDTELYDDLEMKLGAENNPRFLETRSIYVAGRPWTIRFESSDDFGETTYSRLAPLAALGAGIAVSILITGIVFTIISSRQRAIAYAEKATADLRQANAKDEAMLFSIGDGLVATDENGKIMLVNHAFEDLLGWKEEEAIGRKFTEIAPMVDKKGRDIERPDRFISDVLNQKQDSIVNDNTKQYRRKDGSVFPVSITVSPIISDGKILGAVEVFRDITAEKEIDKAKTEFVSLASHQLRTPLTAISWYTELLETEGELTAQQAEYAKEISIGAKTMTELVSSLLNVSRIELGTFAVNPEPTDVVELMQSVLKELDLLIKNKHLEIEFPHSEIPKIDLDPKVFRIVYQNLLTNAVKYTPEKGKITITHEVKDDKLLVKVTDTGYGIPESQQNQIFSKLFRADNVRSKDTNGTGLGLYIVKAIVEQSNGKIWFESVENAGTAFFIEMPMSGMVAKDGARMLT